MKFCGACGTEFRPTTIGETPQICPSCGLEWWDPPVPVAIALVRDWDDNIVYTRNDNFPVGKWGLVAGFVERGESIEEAAVREVKEETGLNVRIVRYIGSSVGSPGSHPKNVYISYLCEPLSGELKAGDDAEEVHIGPVDLDKFIPNSVAYRTVVEAGRLRMGWRDEFAFGGIVVNDKGQVLMRSPAGLWGGYVWTFAKGGADQTDNTPEETALREVQEETGYECEIIGEVPGEFESDTCVTKYFLMKPTGKITEFDHETQEVKWVSADEAFEMIKLTKSHKGRRRDTDALTNAIDVWASMRREPS